MTLTLSNCIERINQALDYPSIEYADISHYFDQAISELNSTLRIGLRPITQLLAESAFNLGNYTNVVSLTELPNTFPTAESTDAANLAGYMYFYNTTDRKLYKKSNSDWTPYDNLFGYIPNSADVSNQVYTTYVYAKGLCMWVPYNTDPLQTFELTDYLPVDVIILFVIPYVCFKYNVRDGGSGQLFREEFTQGFQQIQTSYDIPNYVRLSEVAGRKAYTEDVKSNIPNLNATVPVRAIYDSMKIGNAVPPTYGGFYEGGGWGL